MKYLSEVIFEVEEEKEDGKGLIPSKHIDSDMIRIENDNSKSYVDEFQLLYDYFVFYIFLYDIRTKYDLFFNFLFFKYQTNIL